MCVLCVRLFACFILHVLGKCVFVVVARDCLRLLPLVLPLFFCVDFGGWAVCLCLFLLAVYVSGVCSLFVWLFYGLIVLLSCCVCCCLFAFVVFWGRCRFLVVCVAWFVLCVL